MKTIEERLKFISEDLGLTPSGLGKLTNVDASTLYKAFKGEATLGMTTLNRICETCFRRGNYIVRIDMSWLVGKDQPGEVSPYIIKEELYSIAW